MGKLILTSIVSGSLMLGGALGLAEELKLVGKPFAKVEMQVGEKRPIPSFEKRLNLKPLTDEELEQITAAGIGPIAYMLPLWVLIPSLFELHLGFRNSPGLIGGFVEQSNHNFSFCCR